jgi:hypothetical protein
LGGVALVAAPPIFDYQQMARYRSRSAISLVVGGRMIRFSKGVSDYEYSTEDPKKIATLDYYAKSGIIYKEDDVKPDVSASDNRGSKRNPSKKPSKSKKK